MQQIRNLCRDAAYPVPFRMERDLPSHRYRLVNLSEERLSGVSLTLLGAGVMPASSPSTLLPGDILEVTIAGRNLALNTVLIVRWFRPNGIEYLWRVSF
ncbi:MAG: hypothetical protein ACYCZK_06705 [Microbacteriaceae bacterium]